MRKLTQRLSAIIVAGLLVFAIAAAGQALAALATHAEQTALASSANTAEPATGALVSMGVLVARRGGELR
jgi:hypothetical protein